MQRLSRLVDGLLTLSRAENIEPPRRIIDVEKVIEDRCDAWSALADERHLALVAPCDDPGPQTASLAPGDLDQILDNLLANAMPVPRADRSGSSWSAPSQAGWSCT